MSFPTCVDTMDAFFIFFIQHPLRILALAGVCLAVWAAVRATGGTSNALLAPAGLCVAFAAWEWLVMTRSPDANIRVDLLAIWPLLGLVTLWALYRTIRLR